MLDVLAIGVGELQIKLKQVDYQLGDTVRGLVKVRLTEKLEAKRLVVGIEARQRVIGVSGGTTSYSNGKVWRFEKELSGEGKYLKRAKKFELLLPNDLERAGPAPENMLGDVAQVISFLSPTKRFPLEWHVFAFLDRPWKFNVKAKVPITVTIPLEAKKKKKRKKAPAQQ
ncbi:MAG: hypothetical protein QM723_34880 [Myxococcaceae bacterium]